MALASAYFKLLGRPLSANYYYCCYFRRLASEEGIVVFGVCVCLSVCLPVRPAHRNAALVSAAKVMRCIQ